MKPSKVATVMREFKSGELKSSSGKKVTNPKQAIAIGLSEAGMSKPKKESEMKKPMMKKDDAKGMKYGGKAKKMASGGLSAGHKQADGIAKKGKTRGMQVKMAKGGKAC